MSPPVPWGTHIEFVQRYETFHLAALEQVLGPAALVDSIASQIQKRGVTRLLDCAAGTGFPALDLTEASDEFGLDVVHLCDGDRVMIRELLRLAKRRGIDLEPLNPRRRAMRTPLQALDDLVINWRDLRLARGTYDYVLCRGNALAYADTWSGRDEVSPPAVIRDHLAQMAAKVEPGGYLHVDAPWKLTPGDGETVLLNSHRLRIAEQIHDHDDHREWLLHFTETDRKGTRTRISFRRLSSRLTIDRVQRALRRLDVFEDIEPFQLEAERPVYGTIIARKVA